MSEACDRHAAVAQKSDEKILRAYGVLAIRRRVLLGQVKGCLNLWRRTHHTLGTMFVALAT